VDDVYHAHVGVLDVGVGLLERLRLSALVPGLDIAVEGKARVCTHDRVPIMVIPGPERPPITQHIDVSLRLWMNGGHQQVAVLEERDARAAGQELRDGTEIGTHGFHPFSLEPGATKVDSHFSLSPAKGDPLAVGIGGRVRFGLRLGRNGRDRRVELLIGDDE
jgi:hypothetical protein